MAQEPEEMYPCGDHGAQIAALDATINMLEKTGDERHAENGRKLDRIIHETTEANNRLRSLEEWRAAQVVRSEEIHRLSSNIEKIRKEQTEVKEALESHRAEEDGKQKLVSRFDKFVAPIISGGIVGAALLLAKAVWHL